MQNDTKRHVRSIRIRSGTPLYRSIVKIQHIATSDIEKISKVRCVEVEEQSHGDGFAERVVLRYVESDRYIAVSCPWDITSPDDAITGRYHIDRDEGMNEIILPQDTVLERVTKYALACRLPFWIDKLCIDQEDGSEEKTVAIQSMDLVYENSEYTVGLLFIRLDAKKQVDLLRYLLYGVCVQLTSAEDYYDHYGLVIPLQKARAIMEVIRLIVNDAWWERGWIFQEEYLSARRMRLLIRSSQRPGLDSPEFGDIPGELEFSAVDFRKAVTLFCLAYRDRMNISGAERSQCTNVLKKARRYDVLLTGGANRKRLMIMSPTILQEIGLRKMTNIGDILAIAANSCQYSNRLDPEVLKKRGSSLSLALLTLYMSNGEIMRYRSIASLHSFRGDVFAFLRKNALRIEPPIGVGRRGLTFAKHCRFPNVKLTSQGIKTYGIVWELYRRIDRRSCRLQCILPRDFDLKMQMFFTWEKTDRTYLSFKEYEALWMLYYVVEGYQDLAEHLARFLKERAPDGYVEDWGSHHIKYLMARSVARAFLDDQILRLGCIWRNGHYSPYTAIFIENESHAQGRDNHFTFTSWACPAEPPREGHLMQRYPSRYVSLDIGRVQNMHMMTKIKPRRWINGLCFFYNGDARDVTVRWPRYFLE